MVFFDDGYAQYSSYEDVRKVYEQSKFFFISSLIHSQHPLNVITVQSIRQKYHILIVIVGKNVWDDIDPSSTSFIKNYLLQYPEVRLNSKETCSTICTLYVASITCVTILCANIFVV